MPGAEAREEVVCLLRELLKRVLNGAREITITIVMREEEGR